MEFIQLSCYFEKHLEITTVEIESDTIIVCKLDARVVLPLTILKLDMLELIELLEMIGI